MNYKKLKPVLNPKNRKAKDPVRYPKVINGYENKSKRDFTKSLELEINMLIKELNK